MMDGEGRGGEGRCWILGNGREGYESGVEVVNVVDSGK